MRTVSSKNYQLDVSEESDELIIHVWEPMGSMHSELGMKIRLSKEQAEDLGDVLYEFYDKTCEACHGYICAHTC